MLSMSACARSRETSGFMRPTIVTVVAALPHSATGKVAKGKLRESEQR